MTIAENSLCIGVVPAGQGKHVLLSVRVNLPVRPDVRAGRGDGLLVAPPPQRLKVAEAELKEVASLDAYAAVRTCARRHGVDVVGLVPGQ